MTSPGGDREHRVVYRAVADFGKLLAEAAKAKAVLKELEGQQAASAKAEQQAEKVAESARRARVTASRQMVEVAQKAAQAQQQANQATEKAATQTNTLAQSVVKVAQAQQQATQQIGQSRDALGRFTSQADKSRKATEDLDKSLTNMGRRGRSNIGLIIAGITALASLAVPVVATLTAGVGAFVSALGVAGVATAGFAVAAVGQIAKIREEMEKAEKEGVPVDERYERIVSGIQKVQGVWERFLGATREPVLETFYQGLALVQPLLERLKPAVETFARGARSAFTSVALALDSEQFSDFLEFMQQTGPFAIASFVRSLLNIGSGLAGLITSFKTFQGGILSGMERVTKAFADWARGLGESQGFKRFAEYVREVGPQLWDTLVAVAGAIFDLAQALAPIAVIVMGVVRALAFLIDVIPTPALTALIGVLVTLFIVFKSLAIIGSVTAAFRALNAVLHGTSTASKAVVASLGIVGAALTAASLLFSALSASQEKATTIAQDYRGAVESLAEAIAKKNGIVDYEIQQESAKLLQQSGIASQARRLGVDLEDLGQAFLGSDEAFRKKLEDRRKAIQDALAKSPAGGLTVSGTVAGTGPDFGAISESERGKLQQEAENLDDFLAKYGALKGELNTQIDQQKLIEQIMGRQSNALDAQKGKAQELGTEYEKLATKSKPEQDLDRAVSAYDSWASSVEALNQARINEGRVRESSTRSINNAIKSQVDAEKSLADAQRSTRKAQEDLTQARKEAVEQILDAQRKLRDLPDTEESARLQLARAELAFAESERAPAPTAAGLQPGQILAEEIKRWEISRREAALSLKDARENLDDVLYGNQRAREDAQATVAAGVEGSELVIDAKERLAQAQEAELDANTRLRDSVQAVTDARRDAVVASEDAAAATSRLETQTLRAAAAADREALSVGLSKEQVNQYRGEMDKIRDRVETEIALLDPNDAVGKLKAIQTEIEALKLMALNPTMTFDQAWNEARSKIDAAAQNEAKRQESIRNDMGKPSRGAYAEGGRVHGPGGPKQDLVDARLSPNEFVQPVDSVNHYGVAFMEKLRKRQIPREFTEIAAYADGGLVRSGNNDKYPFNLDIGPLDFAKMMRDSGFIEQAKARINEVLGAPSLAGVDYKGPDPTGSIKALIAWAKKFDPSIQMTSGYRPGSRSLSGNMDHHSQGLAADFSGSNKAMLKVAQGFMSIKDRLLQLIHSQSPGFGVNQGKDVGIGFFGSEIAGHYDHVHVAGRKEALGVRDDATGNITGPPGAGVERWRQTVLQALGFVGQPSDYADITLRRMNQESGGNPNAINNWDINAQNGIPSKGLMQVIDPTFRAYRDGRLSENIYDPMANIVASMRYALARYGSLPAAYNRAGGYAEGGMVADLAMFDPSADFSRAFQNSIRAPRVVSASVSPSAVSVGRASTQAASAGLTVGDVTINNPVREPAPDSLRRKLQDFAGMGGFGSNGGGTL